MREGDGGHIINMVSGAGLEGGAPNLSQYGVAKAGLKNLTESLADEWKEYNIQTNCVAPGLIATPGVADSLGIEPEELPARDQVDRYIGRPQEPADIVQFLCSPAASYLNGTIIRAGVPSSENTDEF